MAYTGPATGESGARRAKLAGYLRAANDFGRSYFTERDPNWSKEQSEEDYNSAFQDAAVVRSGNEEMILFPSYAKKHVRSPAPAQSEGEDSSNDADYWQRQWAKHESDKGVTEVEARGWIYTPQRGPHTRRQRLMIGLARQLSGISATADSYDSSRNPSRSSSPTRQEEDLINLEAEHILHEGSKQAENAGKGVFSERPSRQTGADVGGFGPPSKAKSFDELHMPSTGRHASVSSESDGTVTPLRKRESWAQPSKMTAVESAMANKHLLNRLRPFMAVPLVESQVKAFFYNETTSRQRTVFTNPSGHFHCRTILDFVPTHVRILAGDSLSATEEVIVTTPQGVSLISDIDDTVKHTAITSGAREIFRNAFIRDLGDLTIQGVREWYNRLADMGVKMHYVSNSPWQMYPVLTSFFKAAGLPKGSFHLKQYSGMLQGIFEPVAERKKSSLDKIMRDFPERKFILVGDSGEADLEVYTDVVLDNPGRILGVFIRDVTTPAGATGYFDPSRDTGGNSRQSANGAASQSESSGHAARSQHAQEEDADLRAAIAASLLDIDNSTTKMRSISHADEQGRRPTLPPRLPSSPLARSPVLTAGEDDLISFDDLQMPAPSIPTSVQSSRNSNSRDPALQAAQRASLSPPPPPKPQSLRSPSPEARVTKSAAPPIPRKPSTSVRSSSQQEPRPTPASQGDANQKPSPLSQMQRQDSVKQVPPPLPPRRGYREMAREKISSAIATAPSWQDRTWTPRSTTFSRADIPRPLTAISPTLSGQRHPDPSMIPERPLSMHKRVSSSSSLSTSRKVLNRLSTASSDEGLSSSPTDPGMSKKELLWIQRWQRAKSVMDKQGVILRSWRVGTDVEELCVKLVETA